jgi:hypothetical protein
MSHSSNLWSNEISLEDFYHWLNNEHPTYNPVPFGFLWKRVYQLMTGEGISSSNYYEPDACFHRHQKVTLSTNLEQLYQQARIFDQRHRLTEECCNQYILVYPTQMLHLYKKDRYPVILKQRRKLFEQFLATTKRDESPTSILGGVEVDGIMKLIYAFAFPSQDKNKITN